MRLPQGSPSMWRRSWRWCGFNCDRALAGTGLGRLNRPQNLRPAVKCLLPPAESNRDAFKKRGNDGNQPHRGGCRQLGAKSAAASLKPRPGRALRQLTKGLAGGVQLSNGRRSRAHLKASSYRRLGTVTQRYRHFCTGAPGGGPGIQSGKAIFAQTESDLVPLATANVC